MQNWHEDFPEFRTEGGQPGSEGAGIVAFLRERLVYLEDDDESFAPCIDAEAQNSLSDAGCTDSGPEKEDGVVGRDSADYKSLNSQETSMTVGSMWKGGYRLDEIPLMDTDHRVGAELSSEQDRA